MFKGCALETDSVYIHHGLTGDKDCAVVHSNSAGTFDRPAVKQVRNDVTQ